MPFWWHGKHLFSVTSYADQITGSECLLQFCMRRADLLAGIAQLKLAHRPAPANWLPPAETLLVGIVNGRLAARTCALPAQPTGMEMARRFIESFQSFWCGLRESDAPASELLGSLCEGHEAAADHAALVLFLFASIAPGFSPNADTILLVRISHLMRPWPRSSLNIEQGIEPEHIEPLVRKKAALQEQIEQLQAEVKTLKDTRKATAHHSI